MQRATSLLPRLPPYSAHPLPIWEGGKHSPLFPGTQVGGNTEHIVGMGSGPSYGKCMLQHGRRALSRAVYGSLANLCPLNHAQDAPSLGRLPLAAQTNPCAPSRNPSFLRGDSSHRMARTGIRFVFSTAYLRPRGIVWAHARATVVMACLLLTIALACANSSPKGTYPMHILPVSGWPPGSVPAGLQSSAGSQYSGSWERCVTPWHTIWQGVTVEQVRFARP